MAVGDFIKQVVSNRNTKPEDVYRNIVNKVMQKGELPESVDDLDDDTNDPEKLLGKQIYPSQIYIFSYKATNPTTYTYKKQSVKFSDSMPIVLVLSINGNILRGINLNYCNKALKAIILDLIVSLDNNYFKSEYGEMLAANKKPISKKLLACFGTKDFEKQILTKLLSYYKNVDYSFIFRNYNILQISNIRFILPNQWVDLPNLTRTGTTKEETLKAIYKISGIDTVKI